MSNNLAKLADQSGRIWITWEIQRRNYTLSRALKAELFQFNFNMNRFLRYPLCLFKTLFIFLKQKPKLIFVQNPSIVLALFAVQYGALFRLPIIVDAHNAGIYPCNGAIQWANMVTAYLMRHAAHTIVTNSTLADYVMSKGGRPLVIPDPVPEFDYPIKSRKLQGRFNILFVCSWASDEPFYEVMRAAELVGKDVYIYFTGKSGGKESKYGAPLPDNVVLTGFLSEDNFIELMYSSDIVLDLTTREDCLVCGAYEALSLEKPMIISNSKALKDFFHKGAIYTDNTSADLAMRINEAVASIDYLHEEIKDLKKEKIKDFATIINDTELNLAALQSRFNE
jgi:glycosyltransferase involved in cell wall biosynthesis